MSGASFGWDRPLLYRKGSPNRLRGIDLYYDFPWNQFFPDGRAQFRNGFCLAGLAQDDCPPGKTPGLLLTDRDDVPEEPIETDTHFVLVVNLPRYLAQASSDAAASYFAHKSPSGITSISRLREVTDRPEVIQAVFDEHLDVDRIAAWAGENMGRLAQLRALTGDSQPPSPSSPASISKALRALEGLDPEIVEAIAVLLHGADRTARLAFLSALTADQDGRYVTGEALGERILDRLSDVWAASKRFASLLANPTVGETALQAFIEEHPWLLGLDYVRVLPQKNVPRGTVDFLLERFDGYHDLLELKDPHDPIVQAPKAKDGVPPPASGYSLSPALAQALAQVEVYHEVLTESALLLEQQYGLSRTRYPRLVVVIGQAAGLEPHCFRVLRNLNLSLHRIEIVPYDVLADRAKTSIRNVQAYLSIKSSSDERTGQEHRED